MKVSIFRAPLYANSFELAVSLLKTLFDQFDAQIFDAIRFHVPSNNQKMLDIMQELSFEIDFTLYRLFTKRDEFLEADADLIYSFGSA